MLAYFVWSRFFGCSVLKARYFNNSSVLEAKCGYRPSFVWRSILWGRELIRKGIRWRIGNGSRVRVYNDPWIPTPSTFGQSRLELSGLMPKLATCCLVRVLGIARRSCNLLLLSMRNVSFVFPEGQICLKINLFGTIRKMGFTLLKVGIGWLLLIFRAALLLLQRLLRCFGKTIDAASPAPPFYFLLACFPKCDSGQDLARG